MIRSYITHNNVMRYWKIEILGYLNPENNMLATFKGKTLDGAIKAAQKYCDNLNKKCSYQTLYAGEVKYECNYYGNKI